MGWSTNNNTMNITRENYPLFFLDYFEGRLSEGCKAELLYFLEEHPDLKKEFLSFEIVHLEKDTQARFPGRENLKKHTPAAAPGPHWPDFDEGDISLMFSRDENGALAVNHDHHELALAAYIENDLDDIERAAVESYVSGNPVRERELAAMQRSKPDAGEEPYVFPGKRSLKRYFLRATVQEWKNIAAAAAVIMVAFVSWYMYQSLDQEGFHDMLVDGSGDVPEAVAEAPFRQQVVEASKRPELLEPGHTFTLPLRKEAPEEIPSLVAQVETQTPVLELLYEDVPSYPEEPVLFSSLQVASMALIRPVSLPVETETARVQPERRQEYYWLAYRDRSDLFDDEDGGERASLVSGQLSRLEAAQQELAERTEGPRAFLDEAASTEMSVLGRYARRGLASINNLLGQPVVIDGQTNPEGRRVELAIGDFFEVSKSKD